MFSFLDINESVSRATRMFDLQLYMLPTTTASKSRITALKGVNATVAGYSSITVTPWGARWRLRQITSLTIVYSTVYSGEDHREHQSSASLAFVWGIHRWPVNSPHQWPVTWKIFPFDDVIVASNTEIVSLLWCHRQILHSNFMNSVRPIYKVVNYRRADCLINTH